MSKAGYSTEIESEHTAHAAGRDLSISTKASVEICRWLKHRDLQKAKALLQKVIRKEIAVPYKRFNTDVGHKPGNILAGRYPISASTQILKLLDSVEKNAEFKNLNTENLKVVHINAHKANTPIHYGRHGGRAMKRTHVEVVVAEQQPEQKQEVKK